MDAKLKGFLSELVECTPISVLVNDAEIAMQKDAQTMWLEAVAGKIKTHVEVRTLLNIPDDVLQLSSEEVASYGLIHDPSTLRENGEIDYQKWFNEQNIDKRSNYLV